MNKVTKKRGILNHNEMDSALVDFSNLISNFFLDLLYEKNTTNIALYPYDWVWANMGKNIWGNI